MPTEQEMIYSQEKINKGDWELLKSIGGNKLFMGVLAGGAGVAAAAVLLNTLRGKGGSLDNIAGVISQVLGAGNIAPAIAALAQGGGHGGGNVHLALENTLLKSREYSDHSSMALLGRVCELEKQGAVNAKDDEWFQRYVNQEFVHQPKVRIDGGFIPYQPGCCCNHGEHHN